MVSQIERQIWIMNIVYEWGRITLRDLMNEFKKRFDGEELSRATFKRDKDEISRSFYIDIGCRKSKNDSYYFMENKEDFMEGSVTRILVDRLSSTLQIKATMHENTELTNADWGDRIQIDNYPSGDKYLSKIIKAIKDNYTIKFIFKDFWDDDEEYVTLEPYFVKLALRRWYVIGHRTDNDKIENFCLDRIVNLFISTHTFKVPEDFPYKDYYKYSYGVLKEDGIKIEKVRIKVWDEQVKYLRSLPIHESQKEVETSANYSVFEYYLYPTYDFKMEILSHGSSWEVQEPAWFREDVASGFKMGYQLYYRDQQRDNSEECKMIRSLLKSWAIEIKPYGVDGFIFYDETENSREPQLLIAYKNQFSIIVGYNEDDKLYVGIRYDEDDIDVRIKEALENSKLQSQLSLKTEGWLGWQKTTIDNGLVVFKSLIDEVREVTRCRL